MDEFAHTTHTESHLLERVDQSSVDLAAAEAEALALVQKYCPQPPDSEKRKEGCPLAGNSIGQDRAFLRAYMPKLEQYASYRNVDVSTIKELLKRWYPGSGYVKTETDKEHNAMVDILASIEELRHYRKNVFISS